MEREVFQYMPYNIGVSMIYIAEYLKFKLFGYTHLQTAHFYNCLPEIYVLKSYKKSLYNYSKIWLKCEGKKSHDQKC